MIGLPSHTKIWLAAGVTDMRSGFNSLAAKVQTVLERDPFSGHPSAAASPAVQRYVASRCVRRIPGDLRNRAGNRSSLLGPCPATVL